MLFGSKKPKEEKAIPIEEVQKMTKKGMSDKDIIKHLKGKGYSYESIEGAMLKAVKEGVDDDHPKVVERLDTESPALILLNITLSIFISPAFKTLSSE